MPAQPTKPRVFVTRAVAKEAIEKMAASCDVEVWPDYERPPYEVLKQKAATVDGLFTNVTDRIDAPLIEGAPKLRVISQMAAGLDNVDITACTRRGIPLGYAPGTLHHATADLTFALMLAAARRVVESERWVKAGKWQVAWHPQAFLGQELHGATIGIVGMGQIGQEVARRAQGFEMNIVYTSRTRKLDAESRFRATYADLPTLLRTSDFVTLHVPLTAETRHMIGERELRMMKPNAVLVNIARGAVVDQAALYWALSEKWLFAAALDVTDPEPLPMNSPLLTLENCIVVPHLGSASVQARLRMAMTAAENMLLGLQGQPLKHCANPDVYKGSR